MYLFLIAANTKVKNSFLKIYKKVESILVINNDVCYIDELGSVGVSDLIPCKTLLKISLKFPIPSSCDAFSAFQ